MMLRHRRKRGWVGPTSSSTSSSTGSSITGSKAKEKILTIDEMLAVARQGDSGNFYS